VRCGRAKAIGFEDLGDLHLRYLKGSDRPYTIAYAGEHRHVREHLEIEPMTRDDYYDAVEKAYKCDCGGKLSFDASARCPKCGSARIVEGDVVACYD
jgi:DNA-directed RNA polymerase subunit RPC12/RpoP